MRIFYLLLFNLFFFSSIGHSQLAKGDRTLAWSVGAAENEDYDLAFSQAKAGCMESIHISITWSSLEPDAGEFDEGVITGILDVINIYFPLNDVTVELQLSVTNTTAKEVPADLMSIDFDDPIMISRFKTMLDTVYAHIPDVTLSAINIGNESDILFGVDPAKYAAFKVFLDEVSPYAREAYNDLYDTDVLIGTTLTLAGLTDPARIALCESLNENMDIITTTYYPLDSDFTMLSPTVVEDDFDALVAIYSETSQPIHFAECGYSSGEICNSSEALQAEFYSEVFRVWDKHYAHIKYISVFKLTDWSSEEVEIFGEYYDIDDPIFLEYLQTLGVRTWDGDGENKLAYERILCELEARDWCIVECALNNLEDEKLNESHIKLFPNPAKDRTSVVSEKAVSVINIYSTAGELLHSQTDLQIELAQFAAGIYLTEIVMTDGTRSNKRLVVQ